MSLNVDEASAGVVVQATPECRRILETCKCSAHLLSNDERRLLIYFVSIKYILERELELWKLSDASMRIGETRRRLDDYHGTFEQTILRFCRNRTDADGSFSEIYNRKRKDYIEYQVNLSLENLICDGRVCRDRAGKVHELGAWTRRRKILLSFAALARRHGDQIYPPTTQIELSSKEKIKKLRKRHDEERKLRDARLETDILDIERDAEPYEAEIQGNGALMKRARHH